MRILYVTNSFPYPLTSGYLRHYHLLAGLAARHRVHLLSMVGADHLPSDRAAVEALGVTTEVFPRGSSRSRKVMKLLPVLSTGGMRALGTVAAARIERGEDDVVVFSGKDTAPVLSRLRGLPVVADVCDATSSRLRGELAVRGGRERAELALQWALVRRVERRLARQVDHALFASERDRDALGWPETTSSIVPNGVDTAYWRRRAPQLGPGTVVFTGKLDYPPNEDAALQLAESVLPALRRHRPDVRLLLVGRSPTERLRAAAARNGAVLTGEVPDVRPFLEEASVFVAPLRFGAGIQNKVLEALAMEVPVICSTVAAAGLRRRGAVPPLDVADGVDAVVAATTQALTRVGDDPTPAPAGRQFVEATFSWSSSVAVVEHRLRRLVPDTGPIAPSALRADTVRAARR
jgi:polysaccharide biosynthesis protein PslH